MQALALAIPTALPVLSAYLPLSTANAVYWAGRYLYRLELCLASTPFSDDNAAIAFARSLGYSDFVDAASVNYWLTVSLDEGSISANRQHLTYNLSLMRGAIEPSVFKQFNRFILNPYNQSTDQLHLCHSMMQTNNPEVSTYYNLGYYTEQLDIALRLHWDTHTIINALQALIKDLPAHWHDALAMLATITHHTTAEQRNHRKCMDAFCALCTFTYSQL